MWTPVNFIKIIAGGLFFCLSSAVFAQELKLNDLIEEALKNNPEILAAQARAEAAKYKIPQAKSLPDPMVMFGYQNEGWDRYTYGEMQDAQWMFSASQMFPFPGKRSLKETMAAKDAESINASYAATQLKTIAKVKELYFDLFLTYKNIDLTRNKTSLFSRIEEAALARYSSGMAPQQEVIMAQTEKYMVIEKEEMFKQKIQALEAMLNSTLGRGSNTPLGRPVEPVSVALPATLDELIEKAYTNSPEIKAREKMISGAEAKVELAKKEYYPDFTINAGVSKRQGMFEDMWYVTNTINIPLYFRSKQRQGVFEAQASLSEAQSECESIKLMIASAIRDNYSMFKAAEKLTELYQSALIPKTYQGFESAIAGYVTGKVEAITTISRLKSLFDYELLYWGQVIEREKAIARIEAITGGADFITAMGEK
ncbi:MAG: TolC family protein [Thermodesulfobacteriota bacterium]|jgi:outer membrane protein TolC|nr:MAG: TolC family protein [Thermodesulfobacteriota bacterium]